MIFFDNLFSYQNKRLLTYCLSSEHDLSNPRQSLARGNFLALRQRQRDNVIEPQGQEKIRKILRSRCLARVATTNIVKMENPTTLRPDNMVTLSRQCCRVPSSANLASVSLWIWSLYWWVVSVVWNWKELSGSSLSASSMSIAPSSSSSSSPLLMASSMSTAPSLDDDENFVAGTDVVWPSNVKC